MKSRAELNKSLGSSLLNKAKILLLSLAFLIPSPALSEDVIGEINLPPASFTRIDDAELLRDLGLEGYDSAWCYDTHANAILITLPARIRAQCDLKIQFELEKQRLSHQLKIDKLNIRIETLIKQHSEINLIKDKEIDSLTQAALKRPNDYSAWWATGGFVAGILTTIGIILAL